MVTKLQNAKAGNLNVPAILEFFGGRQTLVNDLEKYEIVKLTPFAIGKWRLRKDIPAARRTDLLTLARLKGGRFKMFNFSNYTLDKPAKKKAA